MQHLYKTIFLLFTMLFFSLIAFSQKANEEREIVMSKQELESFLRKIAELKKQRMQQKTEENIDYLYRSYQEGNRTNNYYYQSNEITREVERLNRRLDALMARDNETADYDRYSNSQNSDRLTQPDYAKQPASSIPPTVTVTPSPTVTVVNKQPPLTGSVMLPANSAGNNKKIDALQTQVEALNKELYNLSSLSGQDTSSGYRKEINNLNEQIARLKTEIADAAAVRPEENRQRLRGLEQYRYNIYFAVNSTGINRTDKDELRRLAATVKANEDRVTVIINGFASRTGSAMYNNQLSFSRTEAVKQILLQTGLSARNIVSLHHGVDNSKNLSRARRAEITLLVY